MPPLLLLLPVPPPLLLLLLLLLGYHRCAQPGEMAACQEPQTW
jgi:hypothetical protein